MGASKQNERSRAELAELPADLVQRFAQMAMTLPPTESDGGASIVESILNATSVEALDAAWDAKDADAMIGKEITITGATVSQSDYNGGLGVFLVVTATDEGTGEVITFTTGSMSIVAQVVAAHVREWLPLRCKLVQAMEPTKSGYYPQRLEILDQAVPAGR